ncbi:MAG: alpha-1,2-fucosyltransferase [Candidatus Pacebacteria bacterium]|jgi:hypothetical protein|nr:alpha-1,2-fucosyltransferase [Candidatus Paceibacterota bacterium]
MISFSKLGNYGRLGNQLFQYAFLRTQAERLGVKFYCPTWEGDSIFNLGDEGARCAEFVPRTYYEDHSNGYNLDATQIQDGTDIAGFFQSDKYFKKGDVHRWFSFNESLFVAVNKKYSDINFSESTGLHVRLGDYTTPQLVFYVPRPEFYKKALELVDHKRSILVFSDDVVFAKKYLKGIPGNFVYMEKNKGYEDLYLMSKCRDVVISSSSFSWWAAFLNTYSDKKVVMPASWFLPGGKTANNDIFVEGWIRLRAHRFYDYYYIKYLPNIIRVYSGRISKSIDLLRRDGVVSAMNEIKKFVLKRQR